ncbi:hypothetical protein COV82_01710 [Candidatus Peregrinibacteria bacterium CG11_big_fil_rev_8_21_14_0_20_46_8]|nr:MAG: hypothetical protein COV82_01710 [Candidatus Peregrinibacteria bacterium CG11_big_fil_rev_8_21_14_0_20_46_8]
MLVTSLIGWGAFTIIITKLEPCTAPGEITICRSVASLPLALFFLSSFVALAATFTLLGFAIRLIFHKDEIYLDHVSISTRQGLLLTLCALGAVFLLLLKALTWWSGLLLVAIALLIELYFSRSAE